MTAKEEYIRALYEVSKTTPPEVWQKFVSALIIYSFERMDQVVSSAHLEHAQAIIGYVRYMHEFREEIKNIDETYQKMGKEREDKGVKRERSSTF